MTIATHRLLASAQRLQAQDRPFALVSVVRVEPPTSASPGDKALVTEDGQIEGWIGGGCAQPVVIRAVRLALGDGRARMIRIAPAAEGHERDLGDVLKFGMVCHSGGTIELFIDPFLPPAHLVVIGDSAVAVALSALAPRVGLQVSVIAHGAEPTRFPDAARVLTCDDTTTLADEIAASAFVVVATQGRRDLQGLRAALALRARKVFFVASARKAQVLRESLVEAGSDAAEVAAIVAPAGHAIGAQTPEEIALSVLAAVVATRRDHQLSDADRVLGPETASASLTRKPNLPLPSVRAKSGSCCSAGPASPGVPADVAQTPPIAHTPAHPGAGTWVAY